MRLRSRITRTVRRLRGRASRGRRADVVDQAVDQSHDDVVAYWDEERVRRAVPRDQRRER